MLQAANCGLNFNFFPPGAEDRNVPAAWGKTAQMAAGNMADDIVYAVVLRGSLNVPGTDAIGIPLLQVVPDHPLLRPGLAGVARSCLGFTDLGNEEHNVSTTTAARNQAPLQIDTKASAASQSNQEANSRHLLTLQLLRNDSSSSSSSSVGTTLGSSVEDDLLGVAQQLLQETLHHHQEEEYLQQQQRQQQQKPSTPHWQRSLQEAAGATVTSPAAFRVEYQLNGTAPMSLGQFSNGLQPPYPAIVLDRLQSMEDVSFCCCRQQQIAHMLLELVAIVATAGWVMLAYILRLLGDAADAARTALVDLGVPLIKNNSSCQPTTANCAAAGWHTARGRCSATQQL
jgi:hypothetical protein